MISYSLSIIGNPFGDAKTGVIKRVPWRLDGSDGAYTAFENGIADLPPIDPASAAFVPLASVTTELLRTWVLAAIDLTFWQGMIGNGISAMQAPPLAPLTISNLSSAAAPVN